MVRLDCAGGASADFRGAGTASSGAPRGSGGTSRRTPRVRLVFVAYVVIAVAVGFVLAEAPRSSAYTFHPPIVIVGNGGFTPANGVTGGTGTPADPYVIAGWNISANPMNGPVWIEATDAYFVIRDSYIQGGTVFLNQLSHARVENVTFADSAGLRAEQAQDVAVIGNTLVRSSGIVFAATTGFEARQNRLDGPGASLEVGWGSQNGVVRGNEIPAAGLFVWSATNVTVAGNAFAPGGRMKVWNSVAVSASGNTFTRGGIELQGNSVGEWASHTITTDNLVNGKPIYYYRDCTGVDVDEVPVGQVIFANCARARAANLNASDTGMGIEVGFSREVVLSRNDLSRNDYGLYTNTVTNLTVAGNRMSANNPHGAWLWNVRGASVSGNAIKGNALWGLYVGSSQGVEIAENVVSANAAGMYLIGDDALTVRNNTVESNVVAGIEATSPSNLRVERNRIAGNGDGVLIAGSPPSAPVLDENWIEGNAGAGVRASGGNATMVVTATRNTFRANGHGIAFASVANAIVHHNNFDNNSVQAVDNPGGNAWDNGYPSGGNWWSDFAGVDQCSGPLQDVCPDPDGIGDTPYVLDADSRDQYPLMARIPTVWSNTPPSVGGIAPAGLEDWTGGTVHDIRWAATDAQDAAGNLTVNASYSGDGGTTWTVIASGLAGSGNPYPWRVPRINASSARVRVCARDTQKATACADGGTFAIDSTPPTVVRSIVPAAQVLRDAPLQVVFSERMNRDSAQAAFSIAPDPGGVSFRWSTEAGNDVLIVDHAFLAADTRYTIEIAPAARDGSDPGNPLATAWSLGFRTGRASDGGPVAPASAGLGAFVALFALLVLVAGALAIGTERGRVSLLTPVVLAVSRRREDGQEDSETRGMIRGYLLVHPGDTFTDIMRNLRLSSGTATWHLRKLELAGIVRSRAEGSRRRYYPSDVRLPRENGGELPEIQQRLVQRVAKTPGQPIRLLAEELGISSQLALYHLRKLRDKGLLCLERRGWWLSAYPPEDLPSR